MYMRRSEAASDVSFMPKRQDLYEANFYNHGTRVHGGGPAEIQPNFYYDQQNQHTYYNSEPTSTPEDLIYECTICSKFALEHYQNQPSIYNQPSNYKPTRAPMSNSTEDDTHQLFNEFCEFLKMQNSRSKPNAEQTQGYGENACQDIDQIPGKRPGNVLFTLQQQQHQQYQQNHQHQHQQQQHHHSRSPPHHHHHHP